MKTNTKKLLKLLAEFPDENYPFIRDHYNYMTDEQVIKYIGILQEDKDNLKKAEKRILSLFSRLG